MNVVLPLISDHGLLLWVRHFRSIPERAQAPQKSTKNTARLDLPPEIRSSSRVSFPVN